MSFIKDTFFGGAEKKAAETQARAGREAIASNERALERVRGDLAPFRGVGERILNPLFKFVSSGVDDSVERENILRDVQGSAAARGKLGSGGTLLEVGRQLYGLSQRNRAQRFNELFNLATLGANAAGGQSTATLSTAGRNSDLITGIGNVNAAGRVGAASQNRNALFSILGAVLGG